MEQIAIGVIIGFTIGMIYFVWERDFYPKYQKWIISIFFIFPPAMLGLLILFSIYNKIAPSIKQKTEKGIANISELLQGVKSDKAIDKLQKLNNLKKEGIINAEEYDKLIKKVKKNL